MIAASRLSTPLATSLRSSGSVRRTTLTPASLGVETRASCACPTLLAVSFSLRKQDLSHSQTRESKCCQQLQLKCCVMASTQLTPSDQQGSMAKTATISLIAACSVLEHLAKHPLRKELHLTFSSLESISDQKPISRQVLVTQTLPSMTSGATKSRTRFSLSTSNLDQLANLTMISLETLTMSR